MTATLPSLPEDLLAPPPRSVQRTESTWLGRGDLALRIDFPEDARRLLTARATDALSRIGLAARLTEEPARAGLSLHSVPGLPAQGYRIEGGEWGWRIEAGDAAGAFYAICTLTQWLALHRTPDGAAIEAPGIRVDDAPAFPTRGVMLDISRNRVPTMSTLFELVDRFAALKINHLQLYVEHTFAYQGHEAVWQGWSPVTAEEIQALDLHCRERFVELVPNQNSFGHLHRWLVHEPYRQLAECPDGIDHPFGDEREPFSLCPTDPRSLDLLADLYSQLLPNFASPLFNVGLDETFDLGRGRSADEVARLGKGRVYLDFLKRVHELVSRRDHRMLFWGDIILEHPELIPELPEDVVALEWGYEADHPFAEHAERFESSGREFWVCPGTSSWLSFAGRATNAIGNLENAAVNGLAHGATGYLVTDWGDQGHLQPISSSLIGWVAGACAAWNAVGASPEDERAEQIAEQVERWWIRAGDGAAGGGPVEARSGDGEPGIGRAIWELAEVYRLVGPLPMNRSVLFSILQRVAQPLTGGAFDALDVAGLERAASAVRAVRDRCRLGAGLAGEVVWAADAMLLACELGRARIESGRERALAELPAGVREQLRGDAGRLAEELEPLWLARHRPGGLQASLRWWSRVEGALVV